MKILLFEPSTRGHVTEYLLNILSNINFNGDRTYTLVVDSNFKEKCKVNNISVDDRIEVIFLTKDEEKIFAEGEGKLKLFKRTLVLRKYILKVNANSVYLSYLIPYFLLAFLPFFHKIRLSGIIYKVFLNVENTSVLKSFMDKILYRVLVYSNRFKNIYLLNDKKNPVILNQYYKTNKFKYLTDPIPNIDTHKLVNVRKQYGISQNDEVFIQFGIQRRKSTLEILQSILLMSDEELANKTFIFAGVVSKNIEENFNVLCQKVKEKAKLLVIAGYISFQDMFNLLYSSDVVFTLYTNTAQSSGFIGYAAFFQKYVIGSKGGLLEKLIIENNLGCCVNINTDAIKKSILNNHDIKENQYVSSHSVKEFASTIIEHL